jgi:hypothetical protein
VALVVVQLALARDAVKIRGRKRQFPQSSRERRGKDLAERPMTVRRIVAARRGERLGQRRLNAPGEIGSAGDRGQRRLSTQVQAGRLLPGARYIVQRDTIVISSA